MVGLLVPKLSDQSDENEGTDYNNTLNIAKARLASGGENVRLKMPEEVCKAPGYPRNIAQNERERSICGSTHAPRCQRCAVCFSISSLSAINSLTLTSETAQ
jgi:hypothetical protein